MLTKSMHRLRETGALSLAPGLVDAGFGSLAGLASALYAARFFEVSQLGLFSVYFVTFQLLNLLPAALLLVPAQVSALDIPVPRRTQMLARSLPVGFLGGLAAIPLVWIVAVLAPGGDRADYVAFGATTCAMVVLSPLQDHVRFMLHMSERSSAAAAVSTLQFVVAAVSIVTMHFLDVPARWIPFLGLSLANAASLGLAIVLAQASRASDTNWPGVRGLLRSGRLLLPAQVLPFLGMLGTAVLVARLASTEALGSAEAARVVASPVLVAGTGLGQVLWPRIMSAARTSDVDELFRASRLLAVAVLVISAGYLAAVGWPHPLNVMEMLVPLAFSVTGLVALRTLASVGNVLTNIPGSALLAIEDNRTLLKAATAALVVQLFVAAALASATGAYALPAAQIGGSIATVLVMLPAVPGIRQVLRRS